MCLMLFMSNHMLKLFMSQENEQALVSQGKKIWIICCLFSGIWKQHLSYLLLKPQEQTAHRLRPHHHKQQVEFMSSSLLEPRTPWRCPTWISQRIAWMRYLPYYKVDQIENLLSWNTTIFIQNTVEVIPFVFCVQQATAVLRNVYRWTDFFYRLCPILS